MYYLPVDPFTDDSDRSDETICNQGIIKCIEEYFFKFGENDLVSHDNAEEDKNV